MVSGHGRQACGWVLIVRRCGNASRPNAVRRRVANRRHVSTASRVPEICARRPSCRPSSATPGRLRMQGISVRRDRTGMPARFRPNSGRSVGAVEVDHLAPMARREQPIACKSIGPCRSALVAALPLPGISPNGRTGCDVPTGGLTDHGQGS
jgi:hypothetical protein